MTTVFAILLLVINIGKGLIVLVNKYAPEEATSPKAVPRTTPLPSPTAALPNEEMAAIVAAVSLATGGRGKVTQIEKV